MSNFDLNHFLYNNTLFEDEDKISDKEVEDVFKDIVADFADDLSDVKVDVKEGLDCQGVSKIIDKGNKKITDQSVVDVVTFSLPLVFSFKVKTPPIE